MDITELTHRMQEQQKMLRLVKQHRPADGVPTGLLGLLFELRRLEESGGGHCHLKELAAHSFLDPSTVSRAVTQLVAQGLVERTADPADRRASLLTLTPSGHAALADAQDWFRSVMAGALRGWTPQERDAFAAMLHRFTEDLSQHLVMEAAR